MFKALLRLLSMFLLAIATIMAVLDATRSISASNWVTTSLAKSWAAFSPESLAQFESLVTSSLPKLFWDPVILTLLGLPGFAIFAGLSLLAALAGHKDKRRARNMAL